MLSAVTYGHSVTLYGHSVTVHHTATQHHQGYDSLLFLRQGGLLFRQGGICVEVLPNLCRLDSNHTYTQPGCCVGGVPVLVVLPSICPSIHPPIHNASIHLSVCPIVHSSIYPSCHSPVHHDADVPVAKSVTMCKAFEL